MESRLVHRYSQNFSPLFFALISLLLHSACSFTMSRSEAYEESLIDKRMKQIEKQRAEIPEEVLNSEPSSPSESYEWAVQAFQAKQYSTALSRFDALLNQGAYVSNFERIPYYMGLSLFHMGRYAEAEVFFKTFLRRQPKGTRAQRARIAYLQSLKYLRRWDTVSTLASEAYEQSTYPTDRVLIKLVLAESLAERSELKGAERELDLVDRMLKMLPKSKNMPFDDGIDKDSLHDRSFYVRTMIAIRACQRSSAPMVTSLSKRVAMLGSWFQEQGRCHVQVLKNTVPKFPLVNPRWLTEITNLMLDAIDRFAEIPQNLATDRKVRDESEALVIGEKHLKNTYYEWAGFLADSIKLNEFKPLVKGSEEQILRRVEGHAFNLSLSSSQMN